MTAEIARNRKTNRVDYGRDSTVALFRLPRIFFSSPSRALLNDTEYTLNLFLNDYYSNNTEIILLCDQNRVLMNNITERMVLLKIFKNTV